MQSLQSIQLFSRQLQAAQLSGARKQIQSFCELKVNSDAFLCFFKCSKMGLSNCDWSSSGLSMRVFNFYSDSVQTANGLPPTSEAIQLLWNPSEFLLFCSVQLLPSSRIYWTDASVRLVDWADSGKYQATHAGRLIHSHHKHLQGVLTALPISRTYIFLGTKENPPRTSPKHFTSWYW